MSIIDVTAYGADNSGESCSFEAVRQAVFEMNEGDTLFFPFGEYIALRREPIEIVISDVRIVGPAVLKGFMFNVHGEFGPVGAIRDCGEDWITIEGGPETVKSEYLQLFSSCNSFTSQLENCQSGSTSPSSGILYDVRFSEIVRVAEHQGDLITVDSDIIFPAYSPEVVSGKVSKASWRLLQSVSNVSFENLTFDMQGINYFRTIQFSATNDCSVIHCEFKAQDLPGRHVMARDSLRLKISNNLSSRKPSSGARGSSWNSFLFGAGCQECDFEGNKIYGDWQAVDFTSYGDIEIEDANGIAFSWHTTQLMKIGNNFFSNCHDGLTTHPGTYYSSVINNRVVASTTGARIRSRNNFISGNQFETKRFGLVFSAYFNNSLVCGNKFGYANPMKSSKWAAIGFLFLSQETFLESPVDDVMITGNQVTATRRSHTIRAVEAVHQASVLASMESIVGNSMAVQHDVVFMANMFKNLKSEIEPLVQGLKFEK